VAVAVVLAALAALGLRVLVLERVEAAYTQAAELALLQETHIWGAVAVAVRRLLVLMEQI
jgi:hypothetical protein